MFDDYNIKICTKNTIYIVIKYYYVSETICLSKIIWLPFTVLKYKNIYIFYVSIHYVYQRQI